MKPSNYRLVCIFLLAGLLAILPTGDVLSQESGQIKNSLATASITGQVVSLTKGGLEGWVSIDGPSSISPLDIDEEGHFSVSKILPGTYTLQFLDIGEIPLGYPVTVAVAHEQTANVILNIPLSISGMSCADKIAMGLDGYAALPEWAATEFGGTALSETGSDQIYEAYGECKKSDNDTRMNMLDPETTRSINSLRTAVEDMETSYFYLSFWGGSEAHHSANRAIATREDFISDIVGSYENDYSVTPDPDKVQQAENTIKKLGGLPQSFATDDPSINDPSMKEYYAGYSDEVATFGKAIQALQSICEKLPKANVIAVADYLKYMLDTGQ